jgi:hypothetical protein
MAGKLSTAETLSTAENPTTPGTQAKTKKPSTSKNIRNYVKGCQQELKC